MRLLPLLLAAAYGLPDVERIPPPDPARLARIGRALATIRTEDGAGLDAAVRDLALCGEAALPAIVRRLNEAEAGERMLLLAAVSPMPRATPLLEQARADPHPAVRAWAQGPTRGRGPALRDLAQRYLDLLAVAEPRAYGDADDDLKPLSDPLGRRPDTLKAQQRRMQDMEVQRWVREERRRAADRFARAGAEALARGQLEPDPSDAAFVAYAALLREEEGDAAYCAAVALVAKGEAAAPALEAFFDRRNHEEEKIVRVLCAIRADGGRGLYASFDRRSANAQRALLDVAPDVLEGQDLLALLEHAALAEDESVRAAALDALLALPAPAGREPARALLDPARFGLGDFRRAAELLARCGDVEPLEAFAALPAVPDGPSGDEPRLSSLRAAAQTALRGARGEEVEAMGRRLLGAESKGVRTLGIDVVRDRDTLLGHAREEPSDDLARAAALRLLALHPGAAEEALSLLQARDIHADAPVVQLLVAAGRIDLVVGLAAREDAALGALGNLERIDPRFEAPLLALFDAAPGERRLAALLPLGTEEVRRRFEAWPDLALRVLRDRGFPCPFPFPLKRFLDGADGTRLRMLRYVAEILPSVEPGFFLDLFRAWGGVEGSGTEEGVPAERERLLDSLARTKDVTSAKLLFEMLLAGEIREPAPAMGTLKCAAKLLDAADLARLLPLLREQVAAERPRDGKEEPSASLLRSVLLRGGYNALGYARVEAALPDLCDVVLDPTLQRAAFEWRAASWAPYWALDALRDFPVAAVERSFRDALGRAEAQGRLAACDPGDLDDLVRAARAGVGGTEWWTRGRALHEVALALCDTLERLPGCDASPGRMISLGGLGRCADAAAAARVAAARRRAVGFDAIDGLETPGYFESRARLYEALGARDAKAIFSAAEESPDPFIGNLAAWYLHFEVRDAALAAKAGETAVRRSAGLRRSYRDTLASVRNAEGRPAEALRLLDPLGRVPAPRPKGNLWHEAFLARTCLLLGEETQARHHLERAAQDRRVLERVRGDPAFAGLTDVFADADERLFLDVLFALPGE